MVSDSGAGVGLACIKRHGAGKVSSAGGGEPSWLMALAVSRAVLPSSTRSESSASDCALAIYSTRSESWVCVARLWSISVAAAMTTGWHVSALVSMADTSAEPLKIIASVLPSAARSEILHEPLGVPASPLRPLICMQS